MDPHSPVVKRIGRTPRNTERISGDDRWAAIELLARRPIGGSVAPLPPAARASSAGPIRASAPVHRRASPGARISCHGPSGRGRGKFPVAAGLLRCAQTKGAENTDREVSYVSKLSNLPYVELEIYTCFSPPRSTTRCHVHQGGPFHSRGRSPHHTRRSNQSWPSLLAGGLRHVTAQQSVSSRGAHAQGKVLVTTACSKEGRRHGGRAASAGQPWL